EHAARAWSKRRTRERRDRGARPSTSSGTCASVFPHPPAGDGDPSSCLPLSFKDRRPRHALFEPRSRAIVLELAPGERTTSQAPFQRACAPKREISDPPRAPCSRAESSTASQASARWGTNGQETEAGCAAGDS